jgi:hypothetical protein
MASQGPGPWSGVLLSDEEALQIIAVLAEVLDDYDLHDAVSAAWSLLGNRLGAQASVADPSPEYLTGLVPGPTADASDAAAELTAPPVLEPQHTRAPLADRGSTQPRLGTRSGTLAPAVARSGGQVSPMTKLARASTIVGSNWLPAQRRSSSMAWGTVSWGA